MTRTHCSPPAVCFPSTEAQWSDSESLTQSGWLHVDNRVQRGAHAFVFFNMLTKLQTSFCPCCVITTWKITEGVCAQAWVSMCVWMKQCLLNIYHCRWSCSLDLLVYAAWMNCVCACMCVSVGGCVCQFFWYHCIFYKLYSISMRNLSNNYI